MLLLLVDVLGDGGVLPPGRRFDMNLGTVAGCLIDWLIFVDWEVAPTLSLAFLNVGIP